MKTRKEIAEEIGISLYRMNEILTKMCVQTSIGATKCFLAPYENLEKEIRTVGEDGRLIRETFITEEGEELIREVISNVQDFRVFDSDEHITRNRWGRRVYIRNDKPYSADPAFYDRNPGGVRYKERGGI